MTQEEHLEYSHQAASNTVYDQVNDDTSSITESKNIANSNQASGSMGIVGSIIQVQSAVETDRPSDDTHPEPGERISEESQTLILQEVQKDKIELDTSDINKHQSENMTVVSKQNSNDSLRGIQNTLETVNKDNVSGNIEGNESPSENSNSEKSVETVTDGNPIEKIPEGKPSETISEEKQSEKIVEDKPTEKITEENPSEKIIEEKQIPKINVEKPSVEEHLSEKIIGEKQISKIAEEKLSEKITEENLAVKIPENKPSSTEIDNKPSELKVEQKPTELKVVGKSSESKVEDTPNQLKVEEKRETSRTVRRSESGSWRRSPRLSQEIEDPIARLNALRANISSVLNEVKQVLVQHGASMDEDAEKEKTEQKDNQPVEPVKFRFVKKVRRQSKIFEEDEIDEASKLANSNSEAKSESANSKKSKTSSDGEAKIKLDIKKSEEDNKESQNVKSTETVKESKSKESASGLEVIEKGENKCSARTENQKTSRDNVPEPIVDVSNQNILSTHQIPQVVVQKTTEAKIDIKNQENVQEIRPDKDANESVMENNVKQVQQPKSTPKLQKADSIDKAKGKGTGTAPKAKKETPTGKSETVKKSSEKTNTTQNENKPSVKGKPAEGKSKLKADSKDTAVVPKYKVSIKKVQVKTDTSNTTETVMKPTVKAPVASQAQGPSNVAPKPTLVKQSTIEQKILAAAASSQKTAQTIAKQFVYGQTEPVQVSVPLSQTVVPKVQEKQPVAAKPEPPKVQEKQSSVAKPEPLKTQEKQPVVAKPEPVKTQEKQSSVAKPEPLKTQEKQSVVAKPGPVKTQEKQSSVAKPEPVKTQEKQSVVAKPEPVKTQEKQSSVAKTEPMKTQEKQSVVAKSEPVKTQENQSVVAKTEPVKTREKQSSVAETEPVKTQEKQSVVAKPEPVKTHEKQPVVAKSEPVKIQEKQSSVAKPEPRKTQEKRPIAAKPESTKQPHEKQSGAVKPEPTQVLSQSKPAAPKAQDSTKSKDIVELVKEIIGHSTVKPTSPGDAKSICPADASGNSAEKSIKDKDVKTAVAIPVSQASKPAVALEGHVDQHLQQNQVEIGSLEITRNENSKSQVATASTGAPQSNVVVESQQRSSEKAKANIASTSVENELISDLQATAQKEVSVAVQQQKIEAKDELKSAESLTKTLICQSTAEVKIEEESQKNALKRQETSQHTTSSTGAELKTVEQTSKTENQHVLILQNVENKAANQQPSSNQQHFEGESKGEVTKVEAEEEDVLKFEQPSTSNQQLAVATSEYETAVEVEKCEETLKGDVATAESVPVTDGDEATEIEGASGEAQVEPEPKPPKKLSAKKMKLKKKIVIKRVKRKLSKDLSVDEKVEPEICEKEVVPHIDESDSEEDVEPEPPKRPKPCIKPRQFEEGDIVMYADRVRKIVKWKKATVLERITSISYKLDIEGEEKPAHISYIKKFTNKKVQFGGKEYLEIDYAQEEEKEEEERSYNIWARV